MSLGSFLSFCCLKGRARQLLMTIQEQDLLLLPLLPSLPLAVTQSPGWVSWLGQEKDHAGIQGGCCLQGSADVWNTSLQRGMANAQAAVSLGAAHPRGSCSAACPELAAMQCILAFKEKQRTKLLSELLSVKWAAFSPQ